MHLLVDVIDCVFGLFDDTYRRASWRVTTATRDGSEKRHVHPACRDFLRIAKPRNLLMDSRRLFANNRRRSMPNVDPVGRLNQPGSMRFVAGIALSGSHRLRA
jgi:hypothetical protein